jgi:hypothetical protein
VKVWDTATGREVLAVRRPPADRLEGRFGGPPRDESQMAFSGDGYRLTACEPGETPAWADDDRLTFRPAFVLTTWDATPVSTPAPR